MWIYLLLPLYKYRDEQSSTEVKRADESQKDRLTETKGR